MSALDDLFGQIEDQLIRGGCERCTAYQTVQEIAVGVYALTVHHDEWCPAYGAQKGAL